MKTIRLIKARIRFLLIILFTSISIDGVSQKGQYYSIADGDFLDMNTWGFNSTSLSCGCLPDDNGACRVEIPANKLVHIRHNITTSCDIYIGSNSDVVVENGGSLTLLGSASMIGDGFFTIDAGGTVHVGGDVNLAGNSFITNNGLLTISGDLTITGSAGLCGNGILAVGGSMNGTPPCNTIVLPISLVYFRGEANLNTVDLSWQTASESNNDYFEIEKSIDGRNYNLLMRIDSKAERGSSSSSLNYSAVDEAPVKGISYYRLKQVDFDKNFKYSSIISINYSNKESDISLFPNPNNGELFASYINIENKNATLTITNTLNSIVFSGLVKPDASNGNKIFAIPDEIPSGIYFCTLTINDKSFTQKIILLPR